MRWFFFVAADGVIELRARAEGDEGLVGDMFAEIRPGESFYGLSYDALRDAGDGVIVVDQQGRASIWQSRMSDDYTERMRRKFQDEPPAGMLPSGKLNIVGHRPVPPERAGEED